VDRRQHPLMNAACRVEARHRRKSEH
jgi:hypothetical protein